MFLKFFYKIANFIGLAVATEERTTARELFSVLVYDKVFGQVCV